MSIIHIQKRDNPYVMIDKRPLENADMSWQAKGMLTYLLSKPGNWNVCVEDLISRSKDGKSSVYATIKELEALGHIVKTPHREKGRIAKWVYDVFEEPKGAIAADGTTSRFSRNRKASSRKASSRKSTTSNNDSNNNELNNNEVSGAGAPVPDWNALFIDSYFRWYEKSNNGEKPKLDKGDYAGLKKIREYLTDSKKGDGKLALQAFEYILQHWAALKNYRYLHTSRSPKQINSNLVNILPILREHYDKVAKKDTSAENPKTLKGEAYFDYYGGLNPNFKQPKL
jgi:hypothetical protein